jgi:hypothetical protein
LPLLDFLICLWSAVVVVLTLAVKATVVVQVG